MRRQLLVSLALLALPALARADAFDRYLNPLLEKAREADGTKEIKQLTAEMILESSRTLPDASAAFLVVQTNDGRMSKVLVQTARQKIGPDGGLVPITLIERYVTYRPGTDQTIHATGQAVYLFDGFHFSFDLGQVVPANLGGDVRFVVKGKDTVLEPVGKAKLFLLTKALPEAAPKKTTKFTIGETFEPKYIVGKYKLVDDGRRSGVLQLELTPEGEIAGSFISDKDGQKYSVYGKFLASKHAIQFMVKFPRTEQVFNGWMFTGTGLTITGWSKLQDREAGFQATRIEEE